MEQKLISLNKLFRKSQIVSVSIIILIFLASILPLSLYVLKSYSTQNLNLLGQTLTTSLQPALVFNDKQTIDNILRDSTQKYSIRKIYVYDYQYNLISSSEKDNKNPTIFQTFLDRYFLSEPVSFDVFHYNRVGQIVLYGSSEKIVQFIVTLLIGIFAALCMTLSVLWFLNRSTLGKIIQEIEPLIKIATLVHQKESYHLRFPRSKIKEFEEITLTFNQLLEKIQDDHNNLETENHRLSISATHDALTKLPNRSMFTQRLSQAFNEKSIRNNTALLFIDNNNFKSINDHYGHPAGDAVLIEMAQRLKRNLREHDLVARLGGDEFAVVLHPIYNIKDIIRIAESLLATCDQPLIYEEQSINFGFSIGIALSKYAQSPEELITQADQAMYQAKKSITHWSLFQHNDLRETL